MTDYLDGYLDFLRLRQANKEAQFCHTQAAYDAQLPPEGHKWKRLPGEAKDGTKFARCVKCGLEAEV